MKKIFTLLASFMIAIAAFSQYGQGNHKDVAYNKGWNKNGNDHYNFSKKERDMKIFEINREYNQKIQAVKSRMFMSRFRKERLIRELEDQRKDEIRLVYVKFNDRRNRFDDDDKKKHW